MSDLQVTFLGETVTPSTAAAVAWLDRAAGVARVGIGDQTRVVLVEGGGEHRVVTVRGRRLPLTVRSWRERMLADADRGGPTASGAVELRASLPGLVVAVAAEPGHEVEAGDALVTIEAMKMQNEVRAPRRGRVAEVAVRPGQKVETGVLLVRLE